MHPTKGILGGSDFGTCLGCLTGPRAAPIAKALCPMVSDAGLSPSPLPKDNVVVSGLHQREETGMWVLYRAVSEKGHLLSRLRFMFHWEHPESCGNALFPAAMEE